MDTFTQAYIECALWASTDDSDETGGESLDANYSIDDLAPETLKQMQEDCEQFCDVSYEDLQRAYMHRRNYSEANAGHDFWLTRNGHGAGFWDRGFGDLRTDTIGGRLSRDAKSFGSCDLYVGDDGKLYIS
jgi:hypothetical protein